MRIVVHHRAFGSTEGAVAEIDLPDADSYAALVNRLDEAFGLTNSIDEPWYRTKDPRVQVLVDSARSTSVGDILVVQGNPKTGSAAFRVAPVGFEQITTAHDLRGVGL